MKAHGEKPWRRNTLSWKACQTEREARLGIRLIPGIGAGLAVRLLRHFGSALALGAATKQDLLEVDGIGERLADAILRGPSKSILSRELMLVRRTGARVVFYGEDAYPESLYRLTAPPFSLYTKGTLSLSSHDAARCVAIVGTRKPDHDGRVRTKVLAQRLSNAGYTIVSGGAAGIDAVAHSTTLQEGRETIALLGSGLLRPYPSTHKLLFEEIGRSGMLISEFSIESMAERGHFPQRNRLIVGLCCAVIVVQCGTPSGALNSAAHAMRIGVPVLTFPGRAGDPLQAGPHQLIRRGAHLVESPEEILALLEKKTFDHTPQLELFSTEGHEKERRSLRTKVDKGVDTSIGCHAADVLTPPLDAFERDVLACLQEEPKHIDQLTRELARPIGELSSKLIAMELVGHITRLPGPRYAKSASH